jgi:hypothetical protein
MQASKPEMQAEVGHANIEPVRIITVSARGRITMIVVMILVVVTALMAILRPGCIIGSVVLRVAVLPIVFALVRAPIMVTGPVIHGLSVILRP